MIPILYPKDTTSFTGEGLGRLSGSISAHALTVINSTYEIDLIYPIDGVHFSEIEEGSIILAPHDESGTLEPYEVYAISRPMNGKVVINAWHISYQLRGIVAKPFTGQSLYSGLSALKQACMTTNNFTFSTTRAVSSPITTTVPMAVRSALGGVEGSFLDVYGGEWDFTGFNCILKNRLGQDTDIRIKYGINLMDATKKTTINSFWTGVVPYWTSDAGNVYYNGVIWSEYADTLGFHVSIPVDCTGDFETEPTQAQMLTWGQTYIANNAKSQIPTSIDVSFAALWQTEEYKDIAALQRLALGDTVTIEYKALGIENTARIVSTDYDILNERYSKMTIGQVRANIAQKLSDEVKEVTKNLPSKDWFEQRLAEDAALITGNSGGYIVLNRDADGHPQELLIMDTPSVTTATNVIRMNQGGIGFSNNGYSGTYNSVWTITGTFDAGMINVINLNASNINTGTLSACDINIGNGSFVVTEDGAVQMATTYTDDADPQPVYGYIRIDGKNGTRASIAGDRTLLYKSDSSVTLNPTSIYLDGLKNNNTRGGTISIDSDVYIPGENSVPSISMAAANGGSPYASFLSAGQLLLGRKTSGGVTSYVGSVVTGTVKTNTLTTDEITSNGAELAYTLIGDTSQSWSFSAGKYKSLEIVGSVGTTTDYFFSLPVSVAALVKIGGTMVWSQYVEGTNVRISVSYSNGTITVRKTDSWQGFLALCYGYL